MVTVRIDRDVSGSFVYQYFEKNLDNLEIQIVRKSKGPTDLK